ncbi:hypothetical protein [Aestuariimicrobium sp. Y1814]|uniref:hypothetical protein n=1 Tax=Aestuariimicrobium sp. Y1814 TaxID=3418742 RepID=UPI003DA6F77E
MRVEGALCFPDVSRVKVLAMAVTEGREQLEALARVCRGVASHAGAGPDGSRFRGHLTLARARRPFDATRWVHVVDAFPGWTREATTRTLPMMSAAGWKPLTTASVTPPTRVAPPKRRVMVTTTRRVAVRLAMFST